MDVIYKYPVVISDGFSIPLPQGAKIIHVESQHGSPCMWAIVNTANPVEIRNFCIHGTGHKIDDIEDKIFIGTFFSQAGHFVWHLFEIK